MRKLYPVIIPVILCAFLCSPVECGAASHVVRRIADNPVSNSVTAICQDDDGFVWLGTVQGVLRYDAYSYKELSGGQYDTLACSRSFIRTLMRDSRGNIWIGCDNGACVWSPWSGRYANLAGGVENRSVNCFAETADGRIFAGTSFGVAMVDPDDFSVTFLRDSMGRHVIRDNILQADFDSRGALWLGGLGGFYRLQFDLDYENKPPRIASWARKMQPGFFEIDRFDRLWHCDGESWYITPLDEHFNPANSTRIGTGTEAKCIAFNGDDVWIGTYYKGLHRYTLDGAGEITQRDVLWINPELRNNLSNSISALAVDSSGDLWVGSVDGAFIVSKAGREQFHGITMREGGLAHNVVSDVCCDRHGDLWAATSDGLNRISLRDGKPDVTHFLNTAGSGTPVIDNRMQAIAIDAEGKIWVGTKRGLVMFDPARERFFSNPALEASMREHEASFVKAVNVDRRGHIWLGFLYGGVIVHTPADGQFRKIRFADHDIDNANVLAIADDRLGNTWIGTKKEGLFRIGADDSPSEQANTITIARYAHYAKGTDSKLPGNTINTVFCNRDNVIFVGTADGLYKYIPATDSFRRVRLNMLDSKEYIAGMVEDFSGALWVFNTSGVYKYLSDEILPDYFELANGAFARIDYLLGSCVDLSGRVFAGGINGVTWFDPPSVEANAPSGKIYISDFSILNREIFPDKRHIDGDINAGFPITLTHNDSHISFEFTTLDFAQPDKIRYCYRLDGFDRDWVYTRHNRNYISYSNLPTGDYTLRIRATNAAGMWSDQVREIPIRVLPPWWATWWSYCIWALVACGLLWGVIYIINARYRYRQNELLNQWKQKFYVNATHGFKNPLTMLQVPLDIMLDPKKELSGEEKHGMLVMMNKNVAKLSFMIRQLMDFRRIDQRRIPLNLVETDLTQFLGLICASFRQMYSVKGVELVEAYAEQRIMATIDPEKIETVMFNLLSNAHTFTRSGGHVTVSCREDRRKGEIYISVADTGTGIKPENHHRIFERFWQARGDSTLTPSGAGIGLALSKELVELHKGSIGVESDEGRGSVFTIRLRSGDKHFGLRQHIVTAEETQEPIRAVLSDRYARIAGGSELPNPAHKPHTKRPRVMVISNDEDMVGLFGFIFKEFDVESFSDTEGAYEYAVAQHPRLIVADTIAANKRQGVELVEKLKANVTTGQIPVIFLTAEDSKDDIALFYHAGIDSFMEKPFDIDLLKARAEQLMRSRTDIREKVRMEMILNPKQERIESADEKFLARAMEVIEKNMSNEAFGLNDFAARMNVSRTVLHSRMQAVASRSPIELLRHVRMQKAAQLLDTNAYNITQVSYMVGFSDARYFSTSFKKQFGVTPREYMNRNKETAES